MNDKTGKDKPDDRLFPIVENSPRTCPGQMEIPTPREQKALTAMRAIKERVKPLKERLISLEESGRAQPGEVTDVKEELARLKQEWDRWERERQEAARERMIILGHEEPD